MPRKSCWRLESSSPPARTALRTIVILICGLLLATNTRPLYAYHLALQPARTPTTRQRQPEAVTFGPTTRDSETLIVNSDGERQLEGVSSEPGNGHDSSPSQLSGSSHTAARRKAKRLRQTTDLGNLFREQVKDYPEEEIARLLKETPEGIKDHFNIVNTHLDPHINLTERVASHPKSYTNYGGQEEEEEQQPLQAGTHEESLCRSVTRNIYPREAHRENSLVYIPNNQEFMQVIQAELCQHPGRDCNYLQDSLPYGMSSLCVQKYSYKKLLFMEPLEKRMASDLFRYPSCCVCHIRSLPFDLRTNANATTSAPSSSSATIVTPLAHEPTTKEDKSGASAGGGGGGGASLVGNQHEPSDRSLRPAQAKQVPKQQQQLQKPASNNQTLVLREDGVYVAPS